MRRRLTFIYQRLIKSSIYKEEFMGVSCFVFVFFYTWYIIKYLLTETFGKQYVLWTLDCQCFPRFRLGKHCPSPVHKTCCFPQSQSRIVNSPATPQSADRTTSSAPQSSRTPNSCISCYSCSAGQVFSTQKKRLIIIASQTVKTEKQSVVT